MARRPKSGSKDDLIRQAAEDSLENFIKLVAPHRVLGNVHRDMLRWWTRDEASNHQLVLLPRDHQKSAMVAYRVAWEITKDPSITVLYISSTANLAEKQLKFIKDILTCDRFARYWPDMIHKEEGKRAKWSQTEIEVDHPKRKMEGVRDPTVFTGGLTTSLTGMHCNIAVLDDVVVQENAYTQEGRNKVMGQYSLLASIETTEAKEWVVGTRYHPSDLYGSLIDMVEERYDEDGNVTYKEPVYEVFQREVEDRGDGTGDYIWPRQQRLDGKWFGFNQEILAKKRAQYLDKSQFFAQYYNNPNDPGNEQISSDYFQYYDRKYLELTDGHWHFKKTPLAVFAAIDFAFSLTKSADYTALVVVGVDSSGNFYILDAERFKTNKITTYFDRIEESQRKWMYRKIRCEVTVAQEAIVEDLKDRARQLGIPLSFDKHRPTRTLGTKEERIQAILQPRYENMSIWHYKSGIMEDLELELKQAKPKHDDLKDALANAIDVSKIPRNLKRDRSKEPRVVTHPRFGGVMYG